MSQFKDKMKARQLLKELEAKVEQLTSSPINFTDEDICWEFIGEHLLPAYLTFYQMYLFSHPERAYRDLREYIREDSDGVRQLTSEDVFLFLHAIDHTKLRGILRDSGYDVALEDRIMTAFANKDRATLLESLSQDRNSYRAFEMILLADNCKNEYTLIEETTYIKELERYMESLKDENEQILTFLDSTIEKVKPFWSDELSEVLPLDALTSRLPNKDSDELQWAEWRKLLYLYIFVLVCLIYFSMLDDLTEKERLVGGQILYVGANIWNTRDKVQEILEEDPIAILESPHYPALPQNSEITEPPFVEVNTSKCEIVKLPDDFFTNDQYFDTNGLSRILCPEVEEKENVTKLVEKILNRFETQKYIEGEDRQSLLWAISSRKFPNFQPRFPIKLTSTAANISLAYVVGQLCAKHKKRKYEELEQLFTPHEWPNFEGRTIEEKRADEVIVAIVKQILK